MSTFRRSPLLPFAALLVCAAPVAAQSLGQTLGYQWLKAVKDENPRELNKIAADRSKLNAAVLDYQSDGEGAIHIAVRANNLEYLRFMLMLGADPNLQSQRAGETPLTMAAIGDQLDATTTLLTYKARLDQANRGGETPLVKAVRFRRQALVDLLLARGADPDKADYTGKTARMYAAEDTRNPQIAKALAAAPKRTTKAVAGPKLN